MSKIWPCGRLCRLLSPIRKLWAEVLGWSLEHSLTAEWSSRAESPESPLTKPAPELEMVWLYQHSTSQLCLPSFWLHQLAPDTAYAARLAVLMLLDCCGTWGSVLILGIVWTHQFGSMIAQGSLHCDSLPAVGILLPCGLALLTGAVWKLDI